MELVTKISLIYICIMTIIGFLTMYIDKRRAINKKWRISEKTLFVVAIMGGSIGSNLGMMICRHKTKHWYFVIGMPMILILQIILVHLLLKYLQ